MKVYQVEIENTTHYMSYAQLSALMSQQNAVDLADDLFKEFSIPVELLDGKVGRLRQVDLPQIAPINYDERRMFEVEISTTVPVSYQLFVKADSMTEAADGVQRMLSQKNAMARIKRPNFQNELFEQMVFWYEESDHEDWEVGEARLSYNDTETLI